MCFNDVKFIYCFFLARSSSLFFFFSIFYVVNSVLFSVGGDTGVGGLFYLCKRKMWFVSSVNLLVICVFFSAFSPRSFDNSVRDGKTTYIFVCEELLWKRITDWSLVRFHCFCGLHREGVYVGKRSVQLIFNGTSVKRLEI